MNAQQSLSPDDINNLGKMFGPSDPLKGITGEGLIKLLGLEAPGGTWSEPESITTELPPVPAFNLQLLPKSLRASVEDTADRMQVAIDFPAVTAVMCLAGALNRRALVQPKRADHSWAVTPNLWGGIVAPPGQMKSPVISAITAPLRAIESEWRKEN